MKKIAVVTLFICCNVLAMSQSINIIPKPNKLTAKDGTFTLSTTTVIVASAEENNSVNFLNDYLQSYYGFTLKTAKAATKNFIRLTTKKTLAAGVEGKYDFVANPTSISISGENLAGTFYGVQSLLQLLPQEKSTTLKIACVEINDEPRFQYRGLMLDAGRHFFAASFVKKYIDYIAMFKLNTFHWHLTDDQGWRIEIKKYPKLTSVGGFRNGTIIGHYPGTGNDNEHYGGFYTQEEVKEIVQYAKDRFITVIPEIEMPGHASAAIAAYPELSCFPKEPTNLKANPSTASLQAEKNGTPKMVQETWGVFEDVFCPSETTFHFLQDVLDEVMPLFPSQYVHIGGDECPKEAWKKSAFCQQLIKEKGLKDEHGLQSYFISTMEKYINSKGKKIIGWDEILEGGLAPNATVMSWRGEQGGIDAAKQGHDVIMTPGEYLYIDHSQSKKEDSVTIGGFLPLDKVYSYNPIPNTLSADEAKHVLGAQANLWTEYIGNTSKVEYMIFPRLAALSEVLWTKTPSKDYKDFEKRLPSLFQKLDNMKVNYSRAYYDLKAIISPSTDYNGVLFDVKSSFDGGKITSGFQAGNSSDAFAYSKEHTAPILITSSGTAAAKIELNGKTVQEQRQQFSFNKATGKKITIGQIPAASYPGNGAFTLVDGIQNTKGTAASSEFLGFNGKDCDILIDLGKTQTISNIVIHFFAQNDSWIYAPQTAELYGSADGGSYTDIFNKIKIDGSKPNGTLTFTITDNQKNFRYLKISVKNQGTIASGLPGAGNPAWLFLDEIEVI
jgi:hexosaminidase